MKLLSKKINDEFAEYKESFRERMIELSGGDCTVNDLVSAYEYFNEALRVQLDELESLRAYRAKPVCSDEQTIEITFEVPVSSINFDYEVDEGDWLENPEIDVEIENISVDNVDFEIVEHKKSQMESEAIRRWRGLKS